MIRYIGIFLGLVAFLLPNISYAHDKVDPYQTLYYLDGYKCIIVSITDPHSQLASSQAKVYDNPSESAPIIGEAVTVSLENTRVPQVNGRQAILRPNGSTGWVDVKNLYPYSKPCYPVLMANGIHGFGPIPPKTKASKHD